MGQAQKEPWGIPAEKIEKLLKAGDEWLEMYEGASRMAQWESKALL